MTVPTRTEVPDELFDPIPVLDHGFVRLVDFMGSDKRVVDTARLSYQQGTKRAQSDRNLLRYLYRKRHTSPFEKPVVELEIKLPIYIARQLFRHRTHAANEMSARYSKIPDEIYVPGREMLRSQSTLNKQASGELLTGSEGDNVLEIIRSSQDRSYDSYQRLVDAGLVRERARGVLPQSTYTHLAWTQSLHNLLHLLNLRLDSDHAQGEFVQYSQAILQILRPLFPETVEAFEDYTLNSMTFSRMEIDVVRALLSSQGVTVNDSGLKVLAEQRGMTSREISELQVKLNDRLSLPTLDPHATPTSTTTYSVHQQSRRGLLSRVANLLR